MIIENINSAAASITAQYSMYQESLRGIFHKSLDSENPSSAQARGYVRDRSGQLKYTVDTAIAYAIRGAVDSLMKVGSQGFTELPEYRQLAVINNSDSIALDATARIGEAATRDAMIISNEFRKFGLTYELAKSASPGINRHGLLIQTKKQFFAQSTGDLKQVDRLGRRVVSTTYVNAIARRALLTAYNESLLMCASFSGVDIAKVIGGSNDGMQFSISGRTAGLPSYDSICDTVFHPNSAALVGV